MTKEKTIEVIDSWNITGHGIIAELRYDGNGLPKGIRLTSRETGQQWTIISRVLFNHTVDKQKRFPNETESIMHLSFRPIEDMEKSRTKILDKEEQGIFQYRLEPDGHKEKPATSDQLEIEKE